MGEERRRGQGTETRSEGRRCLSELQAAGCSVCPCFDMSNLFSSTFPFLWNLLVIVFCPCPTRPSKTFQDQKKQETCCGGGERGLSVFGELEPFSLLFLLSIISAFTKNSVNFWPFGSKCSCSSPPTGIKPRLATVRAPDIFNYCCQNLKLC